MDITVLFDGLVVAKYSMLVYFIVFYVLTLDVLMVAVSKNLMKHNCWTICSYLSCSVYGLLWRLYVFCRCFGLLISPGRNVNDSDMHVIDMVIGHILSWYRVHTDSRKSWNWQFNFFFRPWKSWCQA